MLKLANRLRATTREDSGFGIVEVIVAMMIFAIVASGAAYTMLMVLDRTRDSRSAQVAANLAAEEIDLSRDVLDLFTLLDRTRTVQLNGDTFTITRTARWVSNPEGDLECGAGGEELKYKKVNVSVKWANMATGSDPIRSDTVIDPKNRINDPALGTILVSVNDAVGQASSGITVTATPLTGNTNGAAPLTELPKTTDGQGCTYILKVKPGNYTVGVEKSGYIGPDQKDKPTLTAPVVAGDSISVEFDYDKKSTFTLNYASNYAGSVAIPNDLTTSYLDPRGGVTSDVVPNASRTRSVTLHPFTGGYEILAGSYVVPSETSAGCLSVDPAAWEPVKDKGDTFVGARPKKVAASPGAANNAPVPMGVVTVDTALLNVLGGTIVAKTATPSGSAKDPGCAKPMTFRYSPASLISVAGKTRIALPFGSWKISVDRGVLGLLEIGTTGVAAETKGSVTNSIVTLDPRTVLVPKGGGDDDDD